MALESARCWTSRERTDGEFEERGTDMNPIEKIRDDLVKRFPNLRITIDPPALESGSWDLDVFREGGLDFVNVEWRPPRVQTMSPLPLPLRMSIR